MLKNNNKLGRIAGVLLVLCSLPVMAGTILEVKTNGEPMTMLTDGKLARLNMASQEYVIIDYRRELVKVVDPQNQTVMVLDVGKAVKSLPAINKVVLSLKKLGSAENVAGYKTNKLEYTANGKSCGVVLVSKSAYQEKGIADLMSAMQTMVKKQRAILGGLSSFINDCTLADMQLTSQVATIGLPMRTLKNGAVETEIRSIKVDVGLPVDTFTMPAGYKTITLEEKIKQATKGMSGGISQMPAGTSSAEQHAMPQGAPMRPQIQEAMRQMQQSGQLTPEMMEQMRRTQQMMQQYRQQR